ncbi:MAG: histone deacetylase [Deltaproteobacteria bacterium]|nr:histone deacetylase [Deltaproteobacteria bacterium]MBW2612029.1 histone deacetylase [Deltaproteobacteria bacterium]MBW2633225.1 histone deacetylase [Deltaproteobacteria bacterium]MBW2678326.1 histone deacetylase [Deltaproteobacteria bacterium]
MKKTGFLFDPRYLLHDTGPYHPEVPERLQAIYKGIEEADLLPSLTEIKALRADIRWIEAVHEVDYIRRFEEVCYAGQKSMDTPDCAMCTDTFETALLAAGGVINAADMVMQGEIDNAFCAVRPPGHHAEAGEAMGFCYFNNVAIAATYLRQKWNIGKVGIIDFDVHHGNGTQHIFEKDPTVFYYSIHQHPSFSYPGTGREFEKGTAEGQGFTKNTPVLPGHGDEEYRHYIKRDLLPAFERFRPEFILVSAGFDAHIDDDMSDVKLSTDAFTWLIETALQLAAEYANGRLISVLEGGYSLKRLPELASNHVHALLDV